MLNSRLARGSDAGHCATMHLFDHHRFRASTWRVDAVSIWGAAIAAVATWVAGVIEGLGMAISLLLAFGVLPLAFVTILLVWQHKRVIETVRGWFSPPMEELPQPLEYMYDPQSLSEKRLSGNSVL